MEIMQASIKDLDRVVGLALKLWPSHALAELRDEFEEEFRELLQSKNAVIFLANERGEALGFAQFEQRHDYVEGTSSRPVGYLEGIFVLEEHRGKGIARALVEAGEDWARQNGCHEFGSDAALENTASHAFHERIGFQEANRIVCFVKKL